MIYLQMLERIGLIAPPLAPLAIASCGNAALAAAVVARAADRDLHVFIPPDAPASVVARLRELGARLTICTRRPDVSGDPCYHAFRRAVADGALPFCCQGNENGLTIEGGETIGYEMLTALAGAPLDRIVIQVGGGALASAVIQAFTEARTLGITSSLPRFHAVQTRGAYPLKRAYDLVRGWMNAHGTDAETALRHAVTHRAGFMWPWEEEPRSLAHGILDDETYDWAAVVKGMLESGGTPIVVTDEELTSACDLANATRGPDAIRAERGEQRGTRGLRPWGGAPGRSYRRGRPRRPATAGSGGHGPTRRTRRGDFLRRAQGLIDRAPARTSAFPGPPASGGCGSLKSTAEMPIVPSSLPDQGWGVVLPVERDGRAIQGKSVRVADTATACRVVGSALGVRSRQRERPARCRAACRARVRRVDRRARRARPGV